MDSLTQAALGAAIGEAILGKKIGNKGAVLGAVVATIPDLDVAFYLFYDKFEMLSIHRGFSHSILFSILGALLLAYFLQKIKWTKDISFQRLLIFAWLALFTHMLLDTFTAYGTQLYLPFSNERVGFDSVNVVDPVYTIPLLLGLIGSLYFYKNKSSRAIWNQLGIVVSSLYLILTLVNKNQVEKYFQKACSAQNINYNNLLTMPVGIANINWYGVAKTDEGIYLQKYSIFQKEQLPFEYFPTNDYLLEGFPPNLVKTMKWFAKGFYTVEKNGDQLLFYNLQVDMRGILNTKNGKAPTMGYFVLKQLKEDDFEFSSGAHEEE